MRRIALAAAVLATACVVGPKAREYPPAVHASGTNARIHTAATAVSGELLEVRDTALVVAATDRVVLVPLRLITEAAFGDLARKDSRVPLSARELSELRFISRFPYGMSAAILDKVLAPVGQTALVVVDR